MSRLDIGVKPDAVKFPEINKGLAFFNPPAGKALILGRLAELLRESGYKLRQVRLTLEGELSVEGNQIRIPGSGQEFTVTSLPPGLQGKVRIVADWNGDPAPARKTVDPRREVLRVESGTVLP